MYWPLTTEYELVPTATQILNLSVQTLLTADNKSIVCDGCICFKVVDVTKFLVDNFDSVECLNQLSLAAIRNVMISHTFEELKYVRQSIDDDLTEEAKNLIEDQFGVDIQYVKLVSLSSAKVINLVGGLTNANTLYNNSNSNIIGTI